MGLDIKKFNLLKKDATAFYNALEKVRCPYFSDFVSFNSKGMSHLKFKSWNNTRPVRDQYMRFKLLKYYTVLEAR